MCINQPTHQSTCLSFYLPFLPINQPMNQWTNEPINESTNQPTNQSMNEWIDEWIDEWMNESINQLTNQATDLTICRYTYLSPYLSIYFDLAFCSIQPSSAAFILTHHSAVDSNMWGCLVLHLNMIYVYLFAMIWYFHGFSMGFPWVLNILIYFHGFLRYDIPFVGLGKYLVISCTLKAAPKLVSFVANWPLPSWSGP